MCKRIREETASSLHPASFGGQGRIEPKSLGFWENFEKSDDFVVVIPSPAADHPHWYLELSLRPAHRNGCLPTARPPSECQPADPGEKAGPKIVKDNQPAFSGYSD